MGTHRYTSSRERVEGEHYIPISSKYTRLNNIYKSRLGTGLGVNEFDVESVDGYFKVRLKTSGNNKT